MVENEILTMRPIALLNIESSEFLDVNGNMVVDMNV